MTINKYTRIGFSADFGGRDAAAKMLPHFKGLKLAAKGLELKAFPYPELAFILRVDGEISSFGTSGIENMDIDRDGDYISLDIVITKENQESMASIFNTFKLAFLDSIPTLENEINKQKNSALDIVELEARLTELYEKYTNIMS
ncbi:MAG: hypothetical protein JKX81_19790 [Arenicella sp.]|nr:hypothetical protein [Arenicella sp.]